MISKEIPHEMPLAWFYPTAELPAHSRNYSREATAEECAAIAASLGLVACAGLHVTYVIRGLGGGRYKLSGQGKAAVTQTCVISLESIENTVEFDLDVEFSPDGDDLAYPGASGDGDDEEADMEIATMPDVEPIENGGLAVGRVVYEALAANIDPYPKKAGATFDWVDPAEKDSTTHPFAALAKLKQKE